MNDWDLPDAEDGDWRKCHLSMDVWVTYEDPRGLLEGMASRIARIVEAMEGVESVTDEEWTWDVPNKMGVLLRQTEPQPRPDNTTNPRKGTNMSFELNIDTENDAFANDQGYLEIVRLLRLVATKVERAGNTADAGDLSDVNGNHVGDWEWEPPAREFIVHVEFNVMAESEDDAEGIVSNAIGGIGGDGIEDVQIQSVDEA